MRASLLLAHVPVCISQLFSFDIENLDSLMSGKDLFQRIFFHVHVSSQCLLVVVVPWFLPSQSQVREDVILQCSF